MLLNHAHRHDCKLSRIIFKEGYEHSGDIHQNNHNYQKPIPSVRYHSDNLRWANICNFANNQPKKRPITIPENTSNGK